MTVLVRRSSLGDVVLLGAVTRALGDVTVVTAPEWAPVAARLKGVTRVVSWPRGADPAAIAAAAGPGRWVDLQGSARSAAFGADATIDKRSVQRRLRLGPRRWFARFVAPRPSVTALYAEACGVTPADAPWIDLPERPRDALVLFPGASRFTKRWTGFAAVGRAWGGPVVVAGSSVEADLIWHVAAAIPGAQAIAERGFDGTFGALARAKVAVANDSGLMHLAGACGVPVVAVFAGTHPDDGFFVHRGEVVQRDLPCRPCSLHGRDACPLTHGACLQVDPADVIAAVRRCAG